MKKTVLLLSLTILAALLVGCGPKNTMSPFDLLSTADVSAYNSITLYTDDGRSASRLSLHDCDHAQGEALIDALRAVPVQLAEPPEITFPIRGMRGEKPDGTLFYIAFTNGHCLTEDGLWYRFAFDFDGAIEKYDLSMQPSEATPSDLPCAALFLAEKVGPDWDDVIWRGDLMRPVAEQEIVPPRAITATLEPDTSAELEVVFHNDSGEIWTYGTGYRLEVELDGLWYAVPSAMHELQHGSTLVAYSVADRQTGSLKLNPTRSRDSDYGVPACFGLLPKGHYRVVTNGLAVEFDQ